MAIGIPKLMDNISFLKNRKVFIFKHKILLGLLLILLGVVGLFLPFLQGIVMILIGGYLLFYYRIKIKKSKNGKGRTISKSK